MENFSKKWTVSLLFFSMPATFINGQTQQLHVASPVSGVYRWNIFSVMPTAPTAEQLSWQVRSTSSPSKTVSKGFSSFMDQRWGEEVMKSHITATQAAKSSQEISDIYLKLAECLSPAAGPRAHFQRPWKSKRCVALPTAIHSVMKCPELVALHAVK